MHYSYKNKTGSGRIPNMLLLRPWGGDGCDDAKRGVTDGQETWGSVVATIGNGAATAAAAAAFQ